jgi:tRNA(Ile)-lysidine synthase
MPNLIEGLEDSLRELGLGDGSRFVVALSGGLDSTALLLALKHLRMPLRAVHVDHQLQENSTAWARHCRELCTQLQVDFQCLTVHIPTATGSGPEAAARQVRYRALAGVLSDGEVLVTAHHAHDQLETLLLRLARGAGVAGMAGIPKLTEFGCGRLARPLLGLSQQTLRDFVEEEGVSWIEDPSNEQLNFDRNYLRQQVVPLLRERWPGIDRVAARLAGHQAEAQGLLEELAAMDLSEAVHEPSLLVSRLVALSPARLRNALRHWLRQQQCELPSAAQLQQLIQLLDSRRDGRPRLRWGAHEVRIYRDQLYLLAAPVPTAQPMEGWLALERPWQSGSSALELVPASQGWSRQRVEKGFRVCGRTGGERFEPVPGGGSRSLKKWFQEQGVVPWMRQRVPLLYCGDDLVAIGDLWQSTDPEAATGQAWRVAWRGRPALN